jgi:hypothetical protein
MTRNQLFNRTAPPLSLGLPIFPYLFADDIQAKLVIGRDGGVNESGGTRVRRRKSISQGS